MENNKKQQQNYARSQNTKPSLPTDSNRKTSELQTNKQRNSRLREKNSTPRNDQQRNQKQQQQQQQPTLAKQRSNVEKRPRPRGGNYNSFGNAENNDDGSASADPDLVGSGAGLAATSSNRNRQLMDYELNSVYAPGSKKQNLNHLLNFNYAPREADYGMAIFGRSGMPQRYNQSHAGRKSRYNKEQFLQANFQFVIRSSAKPQLTASPDTLIDWNLIEQINIQTTEEPQCPICLYPPIAAKLTRCGHAYCWPCLLHYLSLSDKSWRKCPICYEAIHVSDLKSCTIMQQQPINVGNFITFKLMRRRKGFMNIECYNPISNVDHFPLMCKDDNAKRFSKFLIARRSDIVDIIERERRELMADEDESCPEYVFIQQAVALINERLEKLGCIINEPKEDDVDISKSNEIATEIVEPLIYKRDSVETDMDNISVASEPQTSGSSDSVGEISTPSTSAGNTNNKFYFFYQSDDGQNIYLHPLNVKMLQVCYGTLDCAPLVIEAKILQREQHSMDEEHRRKFTCLGHLPISCQFAVVEVDLQPPTISGGVLKLFKEDLLQRKKERQRREREELKREKHINELNDRQMGKLISSTNNLNIGSAYEFPTCGFEESLSNFSDDSRGSNPTSTLGVSYSLITVEGANVASGESPKWPILGASSTSRSNNGQQENSFGAWGNRNAVTPTFVDMRSELELNQISTNLGDVLAKAISQREHNELQEGKAPNKNNKKQKKSKKMLPLFATGMNYNRN